MPYLQRLSVAQAAEVAAHRPQVSRLRTIAIVAGLLTLSLPSPVRSEQVAAALTASDAVTTPGRPVRLEARLVRVGSLVETGLGGEQVEFLLAGKKVGTAMTGGDGRAYLEYTPKMRGHQSVLVRVVPSKRVKSGEASATLAAWERRRPILLVERSVLAVLPKSTIPDLAILKSFDPVPAPGAQEELGRLAEFYFNIVYLETMDEKMPWPTDFRDWLNRHGFPFGLRIKAKPGGERFGETIGQLRAEGWENLQAGVGRSRTFGEALHKERLRVILIADESEKDLPRRVQYARDWREARKLLQQ